MLSWKAVLQVKVSFIKFHMGKNYTLNIAMATEDLIYY